MVGGMVLILEKSQITFHHHEAAELGSFLPSPGLFTLGKEERPQPASARLSLPLLSCLHISPAGDLGVSAGGSSGCHCYLVLQEGTVWGREVT